jgi:hypothetical protein
MTSVEEYTLAARVASRWRRKRRQFQEGGAFLTFQTTNETAVREVRVRDRAARMPAWDPTNLATIVLDMRHVAGYGTA